MKDKDFMKHKCCDATAKELLSAFFIKRDEQKGIQKREQAEFNIVLSINNLQNMIKEIIDTKNINMKNPHATSGLFKFKYNQPNTRTSSLLSSLWELI